MPIIYAINDFALRHRWLSFTPSTPKRPLFFPQTHCPTSPSPSTLRQQRHNSLPTTPSTSFALINAIMGYRNSTPATPSTSFAIFNTKLNSVSFAPSFHSCQRQFSHLRPTLESSEQIPHFCAFCDPRPCNFCGLSPSGYPNSFLHLLLNRWWSYFSYFVTWHDNVKFHKRILIWSFCNSHGIHLEDQ